MKTVKYLLVLGFFLSCLAKTSNAQQPMDTSKILNNSQKSIISISSFTAKGDLAQLKKSLNDGLNAGLSINQVKEVLVHLYAYCGFPRSIRGLQTFMEVLNDRKEKGINDGTGKEATPIKDKRSEYERGKEILGRLTGVAQPSTQTGYSAFAPIIDTFLKEHLFADIFERDVLTYTERDLVTISVISTIGDAEPMLQSHLSISLNVGLTPEQLSEFVKIIKSTAGKKKANATQKALDKVLKTRSEN